MQDPATDPAQQALLKLLTDFAPGLIPYAILGWIVISKLRAVALAADKLPGLDSRLDQIEKTLRDLSTETKVQLGRIHTDVTGIEGRVARLEGRPPQKTPIDSHSSWILLGSDTHKDK